MLDFLLHLAEFDRCELYSALGHSSLFAYLVDGLRMSNGSAWRRMVAARLLRKFPAISDFLADGRLNLARLQYLKDVLTPENHLDLLHRASLGTEKDVAHLVATLRPQLDVKDAIRKLPTRDLVTSRMEVNDAAPGTSRMEVGGAPFAASRERVTDASASTSRVEVRRATAATSTVDVEGAAAGTSRMEVEGGSDVKGVGAATSKLEVGGARFATAKEEVIDAATGASRMEVTSANSPIERDEAQLIDGPRACSVECGLLPRRQGPGPDHDGLTRQGGSG
ncbi:MAG: hypothetical protein IRZ16_17030 [Myxococcaceae bacterium]|nr:hypothetical protein [Myxococcaceae bacterium]